jgi:uncharacterized protein
MRTKNRPLRLLLFALIALALAAALWVLLGVLSGAVALWKELRELPSWAQLSFLVIVILAICACFWLGWRLLRKRPRISKPVAPPTRDEIDERVTRLHATRADAASLQSELEELDRRARSEELYVAVFGEISAGKSSLIRALAPQATPHVDVLGGTTRAVTQYRAIESTGTTVTFADVPGTHEASGAIREQIARDEALRAHVVLYICASDLTRDQDTELKWLRGFGKPLVLVLNKMDQFDDNERMQLQRTLAERYQTLSDAQIVVSAGGTERFDRKLADGRIEHVERDRAPDIAALSTALQRYSAHGAQALESSRTAAVLTSLSGKADVLEAATRERDAEAAIAKYTRRAVVGALAAVMPGSDLVIQGVLATGLIRELGKLYDVPIRDVDIDAFLGQVKLTLRTSASIVLAIAGNVMKAFPGLGTVGGGAAHAIAYGLIFDSLGHAVASTLRDQHALDNKAANESLARLLGNNTGDQIRRIAGYALGRSDE